MATFQKRQKEMKRLDKQREKAERRAQKKLASRTSNEIVGSGDETISPGGNETSDTNIAAPSGSEPHTHN